ncbi:MAG: DUF58 domain-containing protein [Cyanobacteria bacterium SZAS LIN-2]|nr:DUF58 domain-containing protein [Cyanobacteria bacterium SZAS LIN-3]MBS1994974.1 DUF58 domain-containing protein [Cyanobacteria bacterium SZAS LIN-2]
MTASSRLYLLLVLAMVPMILAAFFPDAAKLGLALDVVILIALIIDIRITTAKSLLEVQRIVDDRLSIGRDNEVKIVVSHRGTGDTVLKCQLKDDTPADIARDKELFEFELKPGTTAQVQYKLFPARRGAYAFGHVNVRFKSFLGLFWRELKAADKTDVKVFSDLKALHDLSVRLAHSSELGELHQRKRGQGTDFASLREYAVGDDAKAIDWNATARRDRPVLRTYEAEQEQRLLVLVDAGRMMLSDLEGLTRFDRALNAALCLALTGLTHNDQVGIGIFADKPLLYLPPKRGKSYMNRILESTFAVQPRMVEPDYAGILSYFASAQKGRSLMVVLSDLTDPTGSQSLLSGMANLSPRHLPFCVTLKDRQVQQIASSPIPEDKDHPEKALDAIYKRAIALDLISQRELALSVLTKRGCLVLDCPPQELSDKLVDKYIEVKSRARL